MLRNIISRNEYLGAIIKMYISTLISYLTISLVAVIDAIFIGNLFMQQGQSSVVIINPLIMIINSFIFSIVIGTNTFIGHAVGEKDIDKASNIFSGALIYGAVFLFIILCLAELLLNRYVSLFTAEPTIVNYAQSYGRIILIVTYCNYFVSMYYFSQRMLGNIKMLYIISAISLISNIGLNSIFVYVFNFGISGIAFASLLSALFQLTILLIVARKNQVTKLRLVKLNVSLIWKIFINGLSDGIYDISQAVLTIMNIFIFIYLLNENLSYLYVFSEVMLVYLLIFFALSDSINPLISKAYGENDFESVEKYRKNALKFSFLLGLFAYLIFIVFREPIFKLYGATPEVMPYLHYYSIFYFSSILIWPLNQIYIAYYTAIAKSRISLQISLLRNFVIPMIITVVLTLMFEDLGLWCSFIISEIIVLIMVKYLFRKQSDVKI